jgi:hypothetical protein
LSGPTSTELYLNGTLINFKRNINNYGGEFVRGKKTKLSTLPLNSGYNKVKARHHTFILLFTAVGLRGGLVFCKCMKWKMVV